MQNLVRVVVAAVATCGVVVAPTGRATPASRVPAQPNAKASPGAPAVRPRPAPPKPRAPAARPRPAAPTPWARGVSPTNRARALALYQTGNQFFANRQYARALERYERAVRFWNHPAIRYNMAVCHVNLNRPLEAYRNLESALRFGAGPLGKNHYHQGRTYRMLLLGQLGRVRIRCPQAGAKVMLDSRVLFTGPGSATELVRAGSHVIVVQKPGYLTETLTEVIPAGKLYTIDVRAGRIPTVRTVRRWRRFLPWTVLGSGALITLLGVPLIVAARATFSRYDQRYERDCPDGCFPEDRPQPLKDLDARGRRERAGAYAMFTLGGLALAAGAALVILNQPRTVEGPGPAGARTPAVTLRPVVLPGGGGFHARLRF